MLGLAEQGVPRRAAVLDEERCLPGHPTSWAALAPSPPPTAWGVGRSGCNANATGVGDRCGCGSVRR